MNESGAEKSRMREQIMSEFFARRQEIVERWKSDCDKIETDFKTKKNALKEATTGEAPAGSVKKLEDSWHADIRGVGLVMVQNFQKLKNITKNNLRTIDVKTIIPVDLPVEPSITIDDNSLKRLQVNTASEIRKNTRKFMEEV
ncbi:MAG: hypothetical protein P4L74_05065 [Candidatus Doudnabacteria bacterium]|nr:hypothetical protein [Candidatus Doudnabacteria bacterium]